MNPYGLIPMRKLRLVIDVFLVNKEDFSCFSCQLNISCPDICQMSSRPVALSARMDSQDKASPLTARRDQLDRAEILLVKVIGCKNHVRSQPSVQ